MTTDSEGPASPCPQCGGERRETLVSAAAGAIFPIIEHVNPLQGAACSGPLPGPVGTPGPLQAGEPVRPASPVADAARAALERMQSDHAGAPILMAIAQRLCQDIDDADRISERIAATRMVVSLLNVLDGALFGGAHLPDRPGDDEAPEQEADSDDIFAIGDVPPGVGDAPA